ncbi:short-chain dehydrogenase/reductase SDR [Thermosinus carboxydivorans Nor1]|uniref:Short-chain dehydrogenase/reductase SDR n=1 Tax=Thermosinus carboxydivorans Nor1 TaxID=401526 RepID=A1HSQ5_9FIRM|nr:SDR family oxidoreductase [Thermosinus carboxydivorans]EAX46936.1 short-chain dehydrogenase/reductase SDR [Thermosinus carboxydivorans Nor1]
MANLFDITDKVIVAVGGSGGLGTAICLGLAEAGAHVIPVSRNKEKNAALVAKIEALGRRSMTVSIDATNRAEMEQLKDEIVAKFGRVDVLINAAGALVKKPFLEVGEDEWDHVINVNLKSIYTACQVFGPIMLEQGYGKIINFSSMGAFLGITRSSAYCTTKGGVNQLTKVLACEWGPKGVNVNAIAPGFFKTPLNEMFLGLPEVEAKITGDTPMRRYGKAPDLLGTIIFLSSAASDFVTGAVIPVDGGYLALAL